MVSFWDSSIRLDILLSEFLEEKRMDRLAEKLALAGTVAKTVSTNIEARADALIARGQTFDPLIDKSFSPHESILDSNEKALDAFETMLGQLTNGPLPSSGGLPESPSQGSVASPEPDAPEKDVFNG
jgi:hypothetical protein